jgi:hypothetical protein
MLKRICAVVLAAGLVAASASPAALAETAKKELTPQQQKMKDCAAKWSDEKAKIGAKGRTAYSKFMSGCLKKTT